MKVGFMAWLVAMSCLAEAVLPSTTTTNMARHLSNCVATISKRHFAPGRLLALDTRGAERVYDHVLESLHELSNWPIVLFTSTPVFAEPTKEDQDGCLREPRTVKPTSYVMLTEVQHFARQVRIAHAHRSWNTRAHFLVVVGDLAASQSPEETARNVLATLWHIAGVVNAVVLLTATLDVYTWFPFGPSGDCATSVRTATLLDHWSSVDDGRFLLGVDLFPRKFPKDLRGCPVHVAMFEAPPFVVRVPREDASKGPQYIGIEVQLLQTLAGVYNMTVVYLPPAMISRGDSGGVRLPDGSWTGVFADVTSGRANMTLGCFVPTVARYCAFDLSRGYSTNGVVWVVPKAGHAPRWRSLYNIFSVTLWLLLFLVYNLTVVVVWLLARSAGDPTSYRSLSLTYHLVLGLHLGVSSRQPRTNRLRAFFLLVVLYSLWIDTAYQSSLIGSLTSPDILTQITSLEQLLESDLILRAFSDYQKLYDSDDPRDLTVLRRIGAHHRCDAHIADCLKAVADGGQALLADRALVQFHKEGRGRTPFRPFRSNAFTYFVGLVLPRGSLLLEPFDDVIRRVNQAHLTPKWRRDMAGSFKTHSVKSPRYVGKKTKTSLVVGPQPLTVLHLQGSFTLLGVRCGVALGVFLVELALGRLHRQPSPPVSVFVQ